MQHLDEGTIHSWLDGALSAEEAARAEAHVKECPECAAAVAEARGFIAASSRILTALDNAPRGVIPAVAPKRRVDPMVWRVAAALLVVAGGTLVVVRNSGNEQNTASTAPNRVTVSTPTSAPAPANEAGVPPANVSGPAVSPSTVDAAKTSAVAAPMADFSKKRVATDSRPDVQLPQDEPVAPNAPLFAPSRATGAAMADADAAAEPLPRVVGTSRAIGEKRTLYEVTPGDTVSLSEAVQVQLNSVVAAAPESRQMAERSAARPTSKAAAAAAAPDTQPRTVQTLSAPAVSPQGRIISAGTSNGVTTITWIDPATGTTMRLSGKHSREELEGIRRRIEQARAAAAAQKKSP